MNSAKDLLKSKFDADEFAHRAPKPKISQQTLEMLRKIEERHRGGMQTVPNQEDIRQIYYLFIDTPPSRLPKEFGTLKRIRQLGWALTYSENKKHRIVDTTKLRDALQLIENRLHISALHGVFYALLQAWDIPNAGILRAFVKKHLINYDGTRKSVQKLKTNIAWYFDKNGTIQLATNLLRSQVKLSDVWSYLELPDYTQGYRYFGAVAEAFVALNKPRDTAAFADVVKFVEKHNDDKTSRAILSKFIEQLGYDAPEHLRQPVQSYVLREWKDPRIVGADVHWRDVSDKARQIFTRWITKEDLRFFFDVVAKACNDHKFAYRKAFWLAYLEHISFCRPVLRRNAEDLFRSDHYYQGQKRNIATLKGGGRDQHAFIIQMGGYTFVEFSTAGACYVYDNTNCPFSLSDSEYHMSKLRNQGRAEHREVHTYSERYSWQDRFSEWIEWELEIDLLRSYRLER